MESNNRQPSAFLKTATPAKPLARSIYMGFDSRHRGGSLRCPTSTPTRSEIDHGFRSY